MSNIRTLFDPGVVFFAYAGLSIAIASCFYLLERISESVKIKQKLHVISVVIAGVLFLVFMFLWRIPEKWFLFIVPVVFLITFLNIKATRFCETCGKSAKKNLFSKPKYCSNCGADFNS